MNIVDKRVIELGNDFKEYEKILKEELGKVEEVGGSGEKVGG